MLQPALKYNGRPAPTSPEPRRVTGQFLAKAHLTRRQRAELAAALSTGAAVLAPLTVKQSAAAACVPVLDVTLARRNGKHSNGRSNGQEESPAERVAPSEPSVPATPVTPPVPPPTMGVEKLLAAIVDKIGVGGVLKLLVASEKTAA
jgi:hypothetical protein